MGPIVVIKRISDSTGGSGVKNMGKHETNSGPVGLRFCIIIVVGPFEEIGIVLCAPGKESVLFVMRLSQFLCVSEEP